MSTSGRNRKGSSRSTASLRSKSSNRSDPSNGIHYWNRWNSLNGLNNTVVSQSASETIRLSPLGPVFRFQRKIGQAKNFDSIEVVQSSICAKSHLLFSREVCDEK